MTGSHFTRRQVIGFGIGAAASLTALSNPTLAHPSRKRALSFFHLHTHERLERVYWAEGHYVRHSLDEIDHLLRDFRTGHVRHIDPRLLDLLYAVRSQLGTTRPIEIVSAYRSPATNAKLARNSSGVAKRSLHMRGMAVDLRIPGVRTNDLAGAAKRLSAGGVGTYSRSGFVHVDTGRVRTWGR